MASDTTSMTPTTPSSNLSIPELLEAGFTREEIGRLQALRDCVRCFPTIEFFGSHEWKRLLFLRWRYDKGELPTHPNDEPATADARAPRRSDIGT